MSPLKTTFHHNIIVMLMKHAAAVYGHSIYMCTCVVCVCNLYYLVYRWFIHFSQRDMQHFLLNNYNGHESLAPKANLAYIAWLYIVGKVCQILLCSRYYIIGSVREEGGSILYPLLYYSGLELKHLNNNDYTHEKRTK